MIESLSNARIKNVIKLMTSSRARREQGLFAVEGEKMFLEAPPHRIESVFISEDYLNRHKAPEKCSYEVVTDAVYRKLSDTVSPQGILCVVRSEECSFKELIGDFCGPCLRLLMLEGIQDPGNLGTMIRTAEAAGFDAVIADNNTADFYNPKVIRSTMGSIYRVRLASCKDIREAQELSRQNGVTVYAAHLKGEALYDEISYSAKAAILIGNESRGLSDEAAQLSDMLIRIPMKGQTESLNAATAAAILMYESRPR